MPTVSPGTTRTAWAAGFGEYPLCTSATREGAINNALVELIEELDCGHIDPESVERDGLEVYRDVLWCIGGPGDDPLGDCACGAGHDDDDRKPWIAMAWDDRETVALAVAGSEGEGFDVLVSDPTLTERT